MADTKIQALPGKQEVIVTRMYNAPRDLVFRIVTDPKLIPEWWGPRGLTTQIDRMEVKPGGQWRFIQRDPQGNIFAFHGVYHEVTAPKRLVYTFEWEGMPGHVLLDIESFEEHDGMTICTSQSIFESVQDRDGMLKQGMEGGASETTDRLNELLMKYNQPGLQAMQAKNNSVRITRVFNAPVEKVWRQWVNPQDYLCWFGPKDYMACGAQIDLRVGGKYLNCMEGPDGRKIWSTGTYKEIIEPNRFVCTDSFADEHGNIVPASYYGMTGMDLPLELEFEVSLEDLGGKTRLTLEHCGFTGREIAEQTKQGWNESFDKLDRCLS